MHQDSRPDDESALPDFEIYMEALQRDLEYELVETLDYVAYSRDTPHQGIGGSTSAGLGRRSSSSSSARTDRWICSGRGGSSGRRRRRGSSSGRYRSFGRQEVDAERPDSAHTKPKPRWDVHLLSVGSRAGSLAGMVRPLTAGQSGSAVSPRLSG